MTPKTLLMIIALFGLEGCALENPARQREIKKITAGDTTKIYVLAPFYNEQGIISFTRKYPFIAAEVDGTPITGEREEYFSVGRDGLIATYGMTREEAEKELKLFDKQSQK